MAQCYHCQASLDIFLEKGYRGPTMPRDAECPNCARDLRCCKNCRFYSPGSQWDCSESIEDPVYEKERRNFCPSFELSKTGKAANGGSKSDAKKRFLGLFSEPDD